MQMAGEQKNKTINTGKIVSVRGSVVDVLFEDNLPSVFTLLHTGNNKEIAIEVLTQLDDSHVRGIALTPTQGLSRGMKVETNGTQLTVPVGNAFHLQYRGLPFLNWIVTSQ